MSEKKGIDLENLKVIEEKEVPKKVRYTPYRELLKRIQKGKAVVLSEKDVHINTVRAGIHRLQRRGEFKKIRIQQGKLENGEVVLYIVNPSEGEKEKKLKRVQYKRVPPEEREQPTEPAEKHHRLE
jgi:hypothetical protein